MIQSLEDAWEWYIAVKTLARDMKRLAEKWDDPDLEKFLGRDNHFRDRAAAEVLDKATMILEDLDDLAVLVMFSVFEATVRARTKLDVARETALVQHPAVLHAVKDLKEAIENGSFFRVMEAYKKMDVDLTAQVNQVRKFRNWVAHGRRDEPENNVEPEGAIDRLRRYLERLPEIEVATSGPLSPIEPAQDTAPEPEVT
jgi:hypothetical protein